MPPRLASGPCIEDWAKPGDGSAQWSAKRRWSAAVVEWADSTGHPPPVLNALNLARTRLPWSREHLRATGRAEWADYYDGLTGLPASTRPYQRMGRY